MMLLLKKILDSWPGRRLFGLRIRRQLAHFEALTRRPRMAQDALLRRILVQQARTDFGREYGFGSVSSQEDFRRQVPIQRYEDRSTVMAPVPVFIGSGFDYRKADDLLPPVQKTNIRLM